MSGQQLAGVAFIIFATGFAIACIAAAFNQKGKGGER